MRFMVGMMGQTDVQGRCEGAESVVTPSLSLATSYLGSDSNRKQQ